MGAIKWMMSLGFIVMFSIAIVSYVANYGDDNSAFVNINDDPELGGLNANLKTKVSSSLTEVNSSIQSFANAEIDSGDETTRTGGQFKGNDVSLFDSIKLITDIGFSKIFGQNSQFGYILVVFMFLMGTVSFLVWWKVWKGGNPD